jgi:hypothetical protein
MIGVTGNTRAKECETKSSLSRYARECVVAGGLLIKTMLPELLQAMAAADAARREDVFRLQVLARTFRTVCSALR